MTNHSEIMKVVEYNNLRLAHIWLDEYKVKDRSLIWEDESGNREGLALKKPSTAFQIPNFVLFLKLGSKWCEWQRTCLPKQVDVRDKGSIPRWGRPPGGGHGHPLQYSCLENPMDRGAWGATVHRIAKSQA